MRVQVGRDDVQDQIPPLVIPSGVEESEIALIMTSIVLRAALEAGTPWHKWILISALQLLHGRPPAPLDAQAFVHLVNFETPVREFSNESKNGAQHCQKTGFTDLSKDLNCQKTGKAEEMSIFNLKSTNSMKQCADENMIGDLDESPNNIFFARFNENLGNEQKRVKSESLSFQRKNIKYNLSSCLDRKLDNENMSSNGAHRNGKICNSWGPVKNSKNFEKVDLDTSLPFDTEGLFLSPPFAVSSPKNSFPSLGLFDCSAFSDDHSQSLTHESISPEACLNLGESGKTSDDITKSTVGTKSVVTKGNVPFLDAKLTSESISKTTKEDLQEVPEEFRLPSCNLVKSVPIVTEVNSNSILNGDFYNNEDKISADDPNVNKLKLRFCTKTPVVVIKKEERQAVENFLKLRITPQRSPQKEEARFREDASKQDVGVRVRHKTVSCGIQVQPKTCTKWIQVRKKKFLNQAVQTTSELSLRFENSNQTCETKVTCDSDIKPQLSTKNTDTQTLLVTTKSVATQTTCPRRNWKLELLSDLPPSAIRKYQSCTDPQGTPLFHGCPLNQSNETIPPLIPLHGIDAICNSFSDPRLE